MDVFAVHERVIADYRAFTSGFVDVRDERIKKFVAEQFAEGVQWPDPWLSLNPSFASGGSVSDLVRDGLKARPECRIWWRRHGRRRQRWFHAFYGYHHAASSGWSGPSRTAPPKTSQDAFTALYERWATVSTYDNPWSWVALVTKRLATRRIGRNARQVPTEHIVGSTQGTLRDIHVWAAVSTLRTRQAPTGDAAPPVGLATGRRR